ncbi:Hypothetical predicted protein [Cloeon dipterum]|uniref:C2H2-type domain-containing protein n=1 Tax=Cloeon dipterum TaxID=197152 RepID=A0A8S1E4F5_9INSE|nr:Hypothetical predicted protein [Cloeon dipterum]
MDEVDNAAGKANKEKGERPKTETKAVWLITTNHGESLFGCPECYLVEYSNTDLIEKHLLKSHNINKKICDICGEGFKYKSLLDRHKIGHNPERPFVCSKCGKAFNRKSNLNKHLVIHSGEKTHICQECGKAFIHKGKLNQHLVIHSGEKTHICQECGKAFYQKSNLNQHLAIHSGEKTHICQECGKAFIHKGKLNKHLAIHSAAAVKDEQASSNYYIVDFTDQPNVDLNSFFYMYPDKPWSVAQVIDIIQSNAPSHLQSLSVFLNEPVAEKSNNGAFHQLNPDDGSGPSLRKLKYNSEFPIHLLESLRLEEGDSLGTLEIFLHLYGKRGLTQLEIAVNARSAESQVMNIRIATILSACPNLTKLVMKNVSDPTDDAVWCFAHFRNLETLVFELLFSRRGEHVRLSDILMAPKLKYKYAALLALFAFGAAQELAASNNRPEDGLKRIKVTDGQGDVRGEYSYVDPNGKTSNVKYTAGKDGFKVEGDHLPKAPAVPQAPAPAAPQRNQQPQQQHQGDQNE